MTTQAVYTLKPTEGKTNCITCTICEKDIQFRKVERVITHVTSLGHHEMCKKKNRMGVTETSQALMRFN